MPTMSLPYLPKLLLARLQGKTPTLWVNDRLGQPLAPNSDSTDAILDAQARMQRFAPLLANLFPELAGTDGHIESALMPADALKRAVVRGDADDASAWFVKRDDALPVAGSIKARGGFHEVLAVAERIALEQGLIAAQDDRRVLGSPEARALFAQYTVAVGSTGNLGLSIGVMAAALGFDTVVHMSDDAKAWKKARLRQRGVRVVEHAGDYAKAVAAGRTQASASPRSHFVDDEQSPLLFHGYAASARHLAEQLVAAGRTVDAGHPLFVYLPCGVGGAPGGITYGLKAIFGAHVHCFFAEPVASPCMLVQLASRSDSPVSVYDIGLDNKTDADGLEAGEVMVGVKLTQRTATHREFRVSVIDTGIGITPEVGRRLFAPFTQGVSTSTRRHGGTGLGLAICRQLVDLMGGGIGFTSTPGRGATFWFEIKLPVGAESGAAEPTTALPPGQSASEVRTGRGAGRSNAGTRCS